MARQLASWRSLPPHIDTRPRDLGLYHVHGVVEIAAVRKKYSYDCDEFKYLVHNSTYWVPTRYLAIPCMHAGERAQRHACTQSKISYGGDSIIMIIINNND